MSKPWRLTRRAEHSLIEIAAWTLETFGSMQAEIYEEELIERCQAIAEGRTVTQSCNVLVEDISDHDVRFARAGEHFVVFVELADEIAILDFVYGRSDLSRRIAELTTDL